MRRSSYTPQPGLIAEPLIVVEESGLTDEEEDNSNSRCSTPQSPSMLNQYLLSPYRDVRKSSLPTPLCTSGITASQVRRLSEHVLQSNNISTLTALNQSEVKLSDVNLDLQLGTDAAPTPREQAFLATLSTAPTQAPGGRRHSVVTISRAPPLNALFGRGRRESIAAFSTGGAPRILQGGRRDSSSSILPRAPSTTNLGSQFNLQLDIMDDIAEMKAARKVKLKMWKTPSQEQVCEVESLEGPSTSAGSPVRYHTSGEARRFSEFAPPSTLTIPPPPKRRASEQVSRSPSQLAPGIICTNNDLKSILSSLASSAQEINQPVKESPKRKEPTVQVPAKKDPPKVISSVENKRKMMKESRSNSFDVSMLLSTVKVPKGEKVVEKIAPSNWFVKRHLPKKVETEVRQKSNESVQVSCVETKAKVKEVKKEVKKEARKEAGKVLWDERAGAVVDAQVLGSAIEVFLSRRGSGNDSPTASTSTEGKATTEAKPSTGKSGKNGSWFGGGSSGSTMKDEDKTQGSETCESSSICSTLKDLFVK